MLVLSRRKNQTIVIEGGIEIQVLQVKGGTVKIGVRAPDATRIMRGELDIYSDMIPVAETTESQQPFCPPNHKARESVHFDRASSGHVTEDRLPFGTENGPFTSQERQPSPERLGTLQRLVVQRQRSAP